MSPPKNLLRRKTIVKVTEKKIALRIRKMTRKEKELNAKK